MTPQEIIAAIIDSLKIVTSWPVVVFLLILIFRKRVEESISILTERLKSVSIGDNSVQFRDSENPSRALVRMTGMGLREPGSRVGEDEDTEDRETMPEAADDDTSDDTSIDEAEIREFDQRIETLRN